MIEGENVMRWNDALRELKRMKKINDEAGQYRQRDALDYAIDLIQLQHSSKECMHRKADGGCKLLINPSCAECSFIVTAEEYQVTQAMHEKKMKETGIEPYTEKVDGVARKRAKRKEKGE